jgi:hypothetical protein
MSGRRYISQANLEYAVDQEEQARLLEAAVAHAGGNPPVDWESMLDGDDLRSVPRRQEVRIPASERDDPLEVVLPAPSSTSAVPAPSATVDRGELFEVVAERDVDPEVVAAAKVGHRFATLHLGLRSAPRLRFYAPASGRSSSTFRHDDDCDGFANLAERTAFIRVDRMHSARLAAEVAAHEVRHLADPDASEATVESYGQWAARVLLGRPDRNERVGRILTIDGSPHSANLRGRVEHGDVVIADRNGGHDVYRNAGTATFLDWREQVPPLGEVA